MNLQDRSDLFLNRSAHQCLTISPDHSLDGPGVLRRHASENDLTLTRSPPGDPTRTSKVCRFAVSLDKQIQLDRKRQSLQKEADHDNEVTQPLHFLQHPTVGVALALLAGVSVILQTGMNTNLRSSFCPSGIATSATSFMVGTVVIFGMSLVHQSWIHRGRNQTVSSEKQSFSWSTLKHIPWYAYGGGLLGASWVTGAIFLAPRLGFATFQLSATAGQLLSGIFCDAIGFLHLFPSSPTPWRVICITVVFAGTALSAKWNSSMDDNNEGWQDVFYIFLAGLAGSVFPIQACLNYSLSQHVGTPFWAVTINFLIGTIVMWILVLFEFVALDTYDGAPIYGDQQLDGDDDSTLQMEWWMWLGGMFGAIIVASVTIGIQILGAVHFTIVFISTQLVSATIADAVGAFSYPIISLGEDGGRRVIGVVLAVIACAAFRLPLPSAVSCLGAWPCGCLNFDHDVVTDDEDNDELNDKTDHTEAVRQEIEYYEVGFATNIETEFEV